MQPPQKPQTGKIYTAISKRFGKFDLLVTGIYSYGTQGIVLHILKHATNPNYRVTQMTEDFFADGTVLFFEKNSLDLQ